MSNVVKLEYGHYYHIYNRGHNRQNIFFAEADYHLFLERYAQRVMPVAETYAYCLLRNHFHFLVRIKQPEEQTIGTTSKMLKSEPPPRKTAYLLGDQGRDLQNQGRSDAQILNPTQQFSNFFNSYTKTINNRYERVGTLFQGRFGRIRVDADDYFTHLIRYIHQNPQKHGFVDDFRHYPYSSYQATAYQKVSRVETEAVLARFDGTDPFQQSHQQPVNERQIAHLIGDDFF